MGLNPVQAAGTKTGAAMSPILKQLVGPSKNNRRRSSGAVTRSSRSARLAIQPLEARAVPAVTAVLSSSLLTVTGTNGRDSIVIHQSGGQIFVDGATITAEGIVVASVGTNEVKRVRVDALGGNDTIRLVDLGVAGTEPDVSREVTVVAGDGDDHVETGVGINLVFGGPGKDVLVGYEPSTWNTFYGEGGNDILDVRRVIAPMK